MSARYCESTRIGWWGVLLADTQGGLQTVILIARRHADIGNDDVRRKLKAGVSVLELWGGLGGPDDGVTDPLKQRDECFTEKR